MTSRYEQAGVSIDAQDSAIHKLKSHVAQTENERVLSSIGSFGGLFDIAFPEMAQPVMVGSTDGIGTKIKVALDAQVYDTVGQCLVNHCINDILVQGARPLFFMDYFATGKLEPQVVEQVLKGMAMACKASGVAILGGELAEMPGFYKEGDFDVAGFIAGVVDRKKILGAARVKPGMKLVGLPSTGLHTNGYSLARKVIFEEQKKSLKDLVPGSEQSFQEALLAVHRNYFPVLSGLLGEDKIAAMAHITGGGFLDNLPRVLPTNCDARLDLSQIEVPAIFDFLVKHGDMDQEEPYRVFNMGIGMILIVEESQLKDVMEELKEEAPIEMGEITSGNQKVHLK